MNERDKSLAEYAAVVRELLQHENNLTNNRLTWLLAVQGILFNAASLYWEKAGNVDKGLPITIAILGILIAGSFYRALELSRYARRSLRNLWQEKLETYQGSIDLIPPIVGEDPKVSGFSWLNPWRFTPWVIVAAWIVLIILICLP